MFINITSCIFVAVVIFEVQSQVCITEKLVTKIIPETYSVSRRRFYGTMTLHTGIETRIIERYNRRTEFKTTKYCCSGYRKEDIDMEASVETCKPICSSYCTNGYCKHPEECACNAGYTQLNGICVPYCEGDCLHGACVAPGTCRCDSGYYLVNGTCQPACTTPCVNGICVSPNKCQCLPGYRKFRKKICYCCNSDVCGSTLSCSCGPNLRLQQMIREMDDCVPECKRSCGNGSCVYPNRCKCFPGYSVNKLNQFDPLDKPVCAPIDEAITTKSSTISLPLSTTKTHKSYTESLSSTSTAVHPLSRSNSISTDDSIMIETFKITSPVHRQSTYNYYNNIDIADSTTTTRPYYTTSAGTTEQEVDGKNSNVTREISTESSWKHTFTMYILIPIMVFVSAGVMIFVWPVPAVIKKFYHSGSYNIQGIFSINKSRSDSFANIHFLPNESQSVTLDVK